GRLSAAGIPRAAITVEPAADMQYAGQGFEVTVPLPPGRFDASRVRRMTEAFLETYGERYGQAERDQPLEFVSWRVRARGPRPRVVLERSPRRGSVRAAHTGRRPAYFDGLRDTPVYDRARLGANASLRGPVIVEERESTLVIPPGAELVIDAVGNAVVTLAHPAGRRRRRLVEFTAMPRRPAAPRRRRSQGRLDPVTMSILWSRLRALVDEAAATLIRTSFSTIVREVHDMTQLLTDDRGLTLAQSAVSTPGFVGTTAGG